MADKRRRSAIAALAVAVAISVVFVVVPRRERDARAAGEPAAAAQTSAPPVVPAYGFVVVNTFPHDPGAFTQGLIYRDGFLFESTGLKGRSSLRKVELTTGAVVQRRDVDAKYFAEGLTDWDGRLLQLTWETNVGFIYDLATFAPRGTFPYEGEGWGLTHDDRRVIMSDGSSRLRFIDPTTLRETARVNVVDGAQPIGNLNELEFVRGEIYANVWLTDRIAMIHPDSGRVTGWIDLTGLLPRREPAGDAVLNGIAYDAERDRLFVTGKLWPTLFEIRLRR